MGKARLTTGPKAIRDCKQDQRIPSIAGSLMHEKTDICAFSLLKLMTDLYLLS